MNKLNLTSWSSSHPEMPLSFNSLIPESKGWWATIRQTLIGHLSQLPHRVGGNRKCQYYWSTKIVKNIVFDCHLSPVGRQMAIKYTVLAIFDPHSSIKSVFDCRLPSVIMPNGNSLPFINWTNLFRIQMLLGSNLLFHSNFKSTFCAKPDQTLHSAASDMVLHCLPMSH